MYYDIHTDFILTPIFEVFRDGVNACAPLSKGMESCAFGEYFLQSLFIRMTGAQEQKMKCICWAIASNDYRYRYEYLNIKHYGECSDYSDKQAIYKDLVTAIKKKDSTFQPIDVLNVLKIDSTRAAEIEARWKSSVDEKRKKQAESIIKSQEERGGSSLSEVVKSKIRDKFLKMAYPEQDLTSLYSKERKGILTNRIAAQVKKEINNSILSLWDPRGFVSFKNRYQEIMNEKQIILTEKELLGSGLQKWYRDIVYDHRNRTAHNTLSYQKDIPSLESLASNDHLVDNYYFRFSLLILIDELFMLLFKRFREQELAK